MLKREYRNKYSSGEYGGVNLDVADNVDVGVLIETLRLLRENNLRYIVLMDIVEGVMTEFMEQVEQRNVKLRAEAMKKSSQLQPKVEK